jgi:hypothetical protein
VKPNLEQTLTKKIEAAKAKTEIKLFKAWKQAKDVTEREELSAQVKVLTKLTNEFNKTIKEDI